MDQFLNSLPRWLLVSGVFILGMILIILSDPPHNICMSEGKAFRESQQKFLFRTQKDIDLNLKTDIQKLKERCKESNSPGGCYDYFNGLRNLIVDVRAVSPECRAAVGGIAEVRSGVWDSIELMTKIAWGSQPPASYYEKFRWLEASDQDLFCQLTKLAELLYGNQSMIDFRERMFKELPGASIMPRQEVWSKIILSMNCNY